MKKSFIITFGLGILIFSCAPSQEGTDVEKVEARSKSESIIDSAIVYHGGVNYYNTNVSFGFRNKVYKVSRSANIFSYSAAFTDSLGNHNWELDNSGLTAKLNNERVALSAIDSLAFAESLNSVVYFAMLPSLLSDNAVHADYDGEEKIKGTDYHRIKVTFSEDGGGVDHDDVYLYWFDKADYSMDYLAYSFHVNKGGSRFRAALNTRRINGIIFQDFENYKGPSPDSLSYIGAMYKSEKLPLLSNIELNRISVIEQPSAVSKLQ